MRKKKRKINMQKIFCFISFIFILTCCLWYGGRFIYFYLDSKKSTSTATNTNNKIARQLIKDNQKSKNFKKYNTEYYFYQDATNNYLMYSNILWRIIKVNEDKSILLISDNAVTSLAYGTNEKDYANSSIIKWLNQDKELNYSGVLENKLNDISNYLVKTTVCTDVIDDATKFNCKVTNQDYYLGLLSIENYVKTGAKKSFINQNSTTYLANQNKNKEMWYINDEGILDQSEGDDILGIRPTITLSSTVQITSGTGTQKDPYKIENKPNLFGSFVKLDNDIWRIYDLDKDNIKLVLMDYIKSNSNEPLEYIYSNNTYRHNDTIYGSLAYYLNHTYLNSLSYKDLILNSYYYNGYYSEENDFSLEDIYKDEIDTKVGLLSIGDIVLNQELNNYFTSTGLSKSSTSVYINQKGAEITSKKVTSKANIIPCITIKKDKLTKGTGTQEDPYRTE